MEQREAAAASSMNTDADYDAQVRRTRLVDPLGYSTIFRYGAGRQPLEEERQTAAGTLRHDFVYLAGVPIAQWASYRTVSPVTTTTRLFHVHTDRMGVARLTSTTVSDRRAQRLVIDAWGGTNASNGGVVNDLTSMTLPHSNLLWRLPGQRADVAGVVNNSYRTYVPELGLYTSPEPMHLQTSSRFFGVQGYQYAAGRPLTYVDPDGQFIPAVIVAAAAALGGGGAVTAGGSVVISGAFGAGALGGGGAAAAAAAGIGGALGLTCLFTGACGGGGGDSGAAGESDDPFDDNGDNDGQADDAGEDDAGQCIEASGGGSPPDRRAQQKQFNDAWEEYRKTCRERGVDMPKHGPERRRFHDRITGQGYGYDDLVEECIAELCP